MTGHPVGHNLLAGSMLTVLQTKLRQGCTAPQSDLEVVSRASIVTYPDVLVRCGPLHEGATQADDPVLIVEMLSPSTPREDLIRKR